MRLVAMSRLLHLGTVAYRDVDPRRGVPPRVVIPFFGALEPSSVSVGVLPRAALVISPNTLIRRVQSLVSRGVPGGGAGISFV